jgi:hypothetical protein
VKQAELTIGQVAERAGILLPLARSCFDGAPQACIRCRTSLRAGLSCATC